MAILHGQLVKTFRCRGHGLCTGLNDCGQDLWALFGWSRDQRNSKHQINPGIIERWFVVVRCAKEYLEIRQKLTQYKGEHLVKHTSSFVKAAIEWYFLVLFAIQSSLIAIDWHAIHCLQAKECLLL
jgi:hypothetical protein